MAIIALQAAISGVKAAQAAIDNTANNIANPGTNGFKASSLQTADNFYQTLRKTGVVENSEAAKRPVGIQIGYGTKVIGTYRNFAQGPLKETSSPLDIALTGPGYFAVALPNGRIGYTRDGSFKRDAATGALVTSDGKILEGGITIPADIPSENITISRSGEVTATNPADPATPLDLGQIELFNFPNENGLEAIGNNTLVESAASGEALTLEDTTDRFQQGWLEQSNVSTVKELTDLITQQRWLETGTRVMRVVDEVAKDINSVK